MMLLRRCSVGGGVLKVRVGRAGGRLAAEATVHVTSLSLAEPALEQVDS